MHLRIIHIQLVIIVLMATVAASVIGSGADDAGIKYVIERYDSLLDDLIPRDAVLEKVAGGFTWVEGPLWIKDGGYLLFSDIPANRVYKWDPENGVSVYLEKSGYSGKKPFKGREPGSNGLAVSSEGKLVLAQHGDRRIVRIDKDGVRTVLADRFEGKKLNSPNDLVFRSKGDLYFTDPPFGLPDTFNDPAKELPYQGVYRLSSDGKVDLLTTDLKAPNGIAFSPDEKTVYLTDVDPEKASWLAYNVNSDGTLSNGRVFHDAREYMNKYPGAPDGLKTDEKGNVFAAGPGGIYVFNSKGKLLGALRTGRATSNVSWGGDGSFLYITSGDSVYRIHLTTKGPDFNRIPGLD